MTEKKNIVEKNQKDSIENKEPKMMQNRFTPRRYSNFDCCSDEFKIEIHIPGVKKEDVKLRVLPDLYDLQAKRSENSFFSLTEYFPIEIDPDLVDAKLDNGLLVMTVKINDPMTKGIDVKIN